MLVQFSPPAMHTFHYHFGEVSESNACFVFASQVCLRVTIVRAGVDQLNSKDADTEKAFLSCNVTTKVLVK